jgi:hypothetical protein
VPDQLYLSYWLRGFNERNMLRSLEKLLARFPFSPNAPAPITLRVYAIEYAEPALLETSFVGIPPIETIIGTAAEFRSPDCAYLVAGHWDLWQEDQGWKLLPSPVVLECHGPEFQVDLGDQLRIELGADSLYLPRPRDSVATARIQSNVKSLLRLSRDLDEVLPVEKRSLWSEYGENFAERLSRSLAKVPESS